jgi:N-acetylglutamate synthase-like GNAT family acetyltransferase
MAVHLQQIEVGSALHASEQRLRDAVLRKPLGRALAETEHARDHTGVHFAAVEEGEVIGCVGLYPHSEGVLRLRQMAINPTRQGEGLGARLIAFAEDWARGQGVGEIEMHARVSAVRFYERCGYASEGEAFEEITIPHIVMRKRL